jgi:hypothetical protein
MCEPVTIMAGLGLAVSTAEAVSTYNSTAETAKAQAVSANQATISNYAQDDQEQVYANNQAYQKQNAEAIQARAAAATSATGAGEAGVSGLSVDALSRSYFGREGQYDDSVNINRDADVGRLQLQQQGFQAQGQSRINSIQQPSALGMLGSIANAGFTAYNRLNIPTNPQAVTGDQWAETGKSAFNSLRPDSGT